MSEMLHDDADPYDYRSPWGDIPGPLVTAEDSARRILVGHASTEQLLRELATREDVPASLRAALAGAR